MGVFPWRKGGIVVFSWGKGGIGVFPWGKGGIGYEGIVANWWNSSLWGIPNVGPLVGGTRLFDVEFTVCL